MFKLNPNPAFMREVKVKVPADGGFRDESFKARFRVISSAEAAAFDLDSGESSTAFLQAVVTGLEDIVAEDGKALSYSDELRDRVIDIPHARIALARTYFEAVSKAREGN